MPLLKKKALVEEPRLKGRPQKNLAIEPITIAPQIIINKLNLQIEPKVNKKVVMSITKILVKFMSQNHMMRP